MRCGTIWADSHFTIRSALSYAMYNQHFELKQTSLDISFAFTVNTNPTFRSSVLPLQVNERKRFVSSTAVVGTASIS